MKNFRKRWSEIFFHTIFPILLSLYTFFYLNTILSSQANAQVLPQIPLPTSANGFIQSTSNTANGLVPTASTLLNLSGDVSTVSKTVNNIITPPAQSPPQGESSNPPTQQGSTSTTIQYPATSNTYYSTTQPQATNPNTFVGPNSPNGSFANIPNRKDILVLNHTNTAGGRIILTKDINEVVFLSDSLDPLRPPLLFTMPPEREIPILFNFEAFLQTDSNGTQHVTL